LLSTDLDTMIVLADELSRLKRENEQLKSENMRFRSIIDHAGLYGFICNVACNFICISVKKQIALLLIARMLLIWKNYKLDERLL